MTQRGEANPASGILIRDVTLLPADSGAAHGGTSDILIRQGKIAAVGPRLLHGLDTSALEIVPGASLLAVPGLVNAHYHSHDVLLKGMFEVMSLERWVVRALPRFYPPRSDRELRVRTMLGAAECLRGGITTVQDMLSLWPLTHRQVEIVRDAYREAGLRVVLGIQLADTGLLKTIPLLQEILPEALHGVAAGPPPPPDMPDALGELERILLDTPPAQNDRVTWAVCPSSPERCSRPLIEALSDLAQRAGVRLFSHVAISRVEAVAARRLFAAHGGSPVRYLHDLGLLGPQLTLAHGVWLDENDHALLARSDTRLVLNPMSNLKTRNGVAPFRAYRNAGITLGLGCDNCSCSDAQNIFQAMKLSVLLAGIDGRDDDGPTAADALAAATTGGARALGLDKTIGRIAPGYRADITFLDLKDPVFRPFNDGGRQLVFGEAGRGVTSVMVDGRFVLRDRRLTTLDEAALEDELDAVMPQLRHDAARVLDQAGLLDPYLADVEAASWQQTLTMSRMLCR